MRAAAMSPLTSAAVATGVICGLGVDGYRLALQHLAARLAAGA